MRKMKDIYDGKTLKVNEEMEIERTREFKYLGQKFSFDYKTPRKEAIDCLKKFSFI